jgi:hypothetical protein
VLNKLEWLAWVSLRAGTSGRLTATEIRSPMSSAPIAQTAGSLWRSLSGAWSRRWPHRRFMSSPRSCTTFPRPSRPTDSRTAPSVSGSDRLGFARSRPGSGQSTSRPSLAANLGRRDRSFRPELRRDVGANVRNALPLRPARIAALGRLAGTVGLRPRCSSTASGCRWTTEQSRRSIQVVGFHARRRVSQPKGRRTAA